MNHAVNDKLDRLLLRDAQAALPDDGFSARVMGALPARGKPAHRAWLGPTMSCRASSTSRPLALSPPPPWPASP